jgi:uncharacterized membrane protein
LTQAGSMELHRSEQIIIVGFVLVTCGMVLLAFASGSSAGGFFFVFPFVFVGTDPTAAILSLLGTAVLLVVFLRFCALGTDPFGTSSESSPAFIRSGGICKVCGQPVPQGAEFCAYCGAPTSGNQDRDYD